MRRRNFIKSIASLPVIASAIPELFTGKDFSIEKKKTPSAPKNLVLSADSEFASKTRSGDMRVTAEAHFVSDGRNWVKR